MPIRPTTLELFYIQYLQYSTVFFKKRTRLLLHQQLTGGFAKIFFFFGRTPPSRHRTVHIALFLKNNHSYFNAKPKTTLPTHRFFTPDIAREKNGLNTLPNIVTEKLTIRHNQHGYLGSHAQQRRYLFYIYKSYYQFPKSSLLSTPHAPPAVLKQSLYTRKIFLVLTPLIN